MRLQGKVAFITGAASGIGRASALRFAAEGAKVLATDIREEELRSAVTAIAERGGEATAKTVDVRRPEDVRAAVEFALARYGRLDILVHCAADTPRVVKNRTHFVDSDEANWDWVIDVHLKGAMICAKAVLPSMIELGSGKIILFGSVAGIVGLAGMADYSAVKGGVIAFTRALAMEVGAAGVNVNCISPGMIHPVPGVRSDGTYLGRAGTPEEVANLVLFLASDEANYITGQNYIIDGGRVLGPKGS